MSPYSTFPTAKLDKRARSPIHPKTQITVDGNGLKKPIRNRIFCNLLFFLLSALYVLLPIFLAISHSNVYTTKIITLSRITISTHKKQHSTTPNYSFLN